MVQGNFVGTDVNGAAKLGNVRDGILIIDSPSNLVGGTSQGAANLISGNGINGLEFVGSATIGNLVQGNFIGTDITGNSALGNLGSGLGLFGSVSNTVGGTNLAARNLISGNAVNGLVVATDSRSGATGRGNKIIGNLIGTDKTGTAALGNGEDGIFVSAGVNNIIGGAETGAGNVISANGQFGRLNDGSSGIEIWDGASSNVVQGNFIGTDVTGAASLGNKEYGVFIQNSSRNSTGGTLAGAGNLIAHNQKAGVAVQSGTNNPVRANSIFANAGLGIDLGLNGVTGNDAGDPDSGPNNLQNYPVLSSALPDSGTLTIQGTLNSRANTPFQLDFYSNNTCDSSGYGQGQTYLGSGNFTTDGSGDVNFSLSLAASAMAGQAITATATDPNGNTSEFSHCLAVVNAVWLSATISANGISVSWPSSASSFRLQSTTNLSPPVQWQDVLDTPVDDGTRKTIMITNDPSVASGFYRLICP